VRLLVFAPLAPAASPPEGGACAPAALLRGAGRVGEVDVDALLIDLDAALSGQADAALDAAAAAGPDRVWAPRSRCDPDAAAAFAKALRRRGLHPDDPGGAVLELLAPPAELLLNGLILDEHPPAPWIRLPHHLSWAELDGPALAAALAAHAALAAPVGPRALELRVRGGGLFDDPGRAAALLASRAHRLVDLRWTGPAGGAALARALFAARAPAWRGGRPARLQVAADDPALAPELRLVADLFPGREVDDAAFAAVHARWRGPHEALARRIDEGPRRGRFAALSAARGGPDEPAALAATTAAFGPPAGWLPAFRQLASTRAPRIVVIPTWQCELRCTYCRIPKQGGKVMSAATMDRALDLLLSADGDRLEMHFFGGEPFTEPGLIRHALREGHARAAAEGRQLRFLFTTNGVALTEALLDELAPYDLWFQLSLDGDRETQNEFRRSLDAGFDSYALSPARMVPWLASRGIPHDLVQVVHPKNVHRMVHNFRHLLDLGYRRVQINYAVGALWEKDQMRVFAEQLALLKDELDARWARGERVEVVNLEETLLKVRINLEVTVDWNGEVLGSSAFLPVPWQRDAYRLGHLDDGAAWARYAMDGLSVDGVLGSWFKGEMAENNAAVGAVMTSFVRHMRSRPGAPGARR
jgi:sulfatase maturation enzyme AslB (radical SAM superfamily)